MQPMQPELTLSALPVGESGYMMENRAQSAIERRLTDLGLVRGTRVTCVMRGPAGDPAAYLIRGALIAIRKADAAAISLIPARPGVAAP